jgi:hypothetical protein
MPEPVPALARYFPADREARMAKWPLLFIAALPWVESPSIAAGPIAPEPAPPAQRQAPPDKIAPPVQLPPNTLKQETTGEAAKELKPRDSMNTRLNKNGMPSSPPEAKKCGNEERKGPDGRCL